MLKVEYSKQSCKFLKQVDRNNAKRILTKINRLRINPIIHDSKRIENSNLFRVRVGKYRILYEVDFKNEIIGIVKIDKRSKIY